MNNSVPLASAKKDANIILAIVVFSFILFSNYNVLEGIVQLSQEHEDFDIDEIFSSLFVLSLSVIVYAFRRQKEIEKALVQISAINKELAAAQYELKTLKGFIPICVSCKKIEGNNGSWEQLEAYLKRHLDAEFSHSYCPSCYESEMKALEEFEKRNINAS